MGQSLSQVYVHIIFSTKNSHTIFNEQIENQLFEYLGGVCRGMDCTAIQVGGYKDHVHILCQLSKTITQSKLIEEIKKRSSKWMKTNGTQYSNFYWQSGYGIFSVNPTQLDIVQKYIQNQKKHHSKKSFRDELRAFYKKYNVEYDEKYIWA